jgi:hypothetical protein
MKIRYNENLEKFEVIITDQETKKINLVLTELKNNLKSYIDIEREDLYFEVSPFLTNEAIKYELLNKRLYIINDLDYNKEFESIVYFKNGLIEFTENDSLYHFINAYNVLEDISRGERVLKNILTVKLIEWLIENDFRDSNREKFIYRVPDNISTKQTTFNNKIFKSIESENLFYAMINNNNFVFKRKYFNAFYHWFSKHIV